MASSARKPKRFLSRARGGDALMVNDEPRHSADEYGDDEDDASAASVADPKRGAAAAAAAAAVVAPRARPTPAAVAALARITDDDGDRDDDDDSDDDVTAAAANATASSAAAAALAAAPLAPPPLPLPMGRGSKRGSGIGIGAAPAAAGAGAGPGPGRRSRSSLGRANAALLPPTAGTEDADGEDDDDDDDDAGDGRSRRRRSAVAARHTHAVTPPVGGAALAAVITGGDDDDAASDADAPAPAPAPAPVPTPPARSSARKRKSVGKSPSTPAAAAAAAAAAPAALTPASGKKRKKSGGAANGAAAAAAPAAPDSAASKKQKRAASAKQQREAAAAAASAAAAAAITAAAAARRSAPAVEEASDGSGDDSAGAAEDSGADDSGSGGGSPTAAAPAPVAPVVAQPLSSFRFEPERIRKNADGSYTIQLERDETICFHGSCRMRVDAGFVLVSGYVYSPHSGVVQLFSPAWAPHSLAELRCIRSPLYLNTNNVTNCPDPAAISDSKALSASAAAQQIHTTAAVAAPATASAASGAAASVAVAPAALTLGSAAGSGAAASAALTLGPGSAAAAAAAALAAASAHASAQPTSSVAGPVGGLPFGSPGAATTAAASTQSTPAGALASLPFAGAASSAAASASASGSVVFQQPFPLLRGRKKEKGSAPSAPYALITLFQTATLIKQDQPRDKDKDMYVRQLIPLPLFYPLLASPPEVFRPLSFHQSHVQTVQTLIKQPTPRVILLCGARNSGKSTLGRFCLNSLLNRFPAVGYLETDIGQCEFTPPGLVSLHVITKPITGRPHCRLQPGVIQYFVGDTTPSGDPVRYLNCVKAAFGFFKERYCRTPQPPQQQPGAYPSFTAASFAFRNAAAAQAAAMGAAGAGTSGGGGAGSGPGSGAGTGAHPYEPLIPLIVNTQGWVKGIGLQLLEEIVGLVQPTDVIELHPEVHTKPAPLVPHLRAPTVRHQLPRHSDDGSGGGGNSSAKDLSADKLRTLSLVCYFGAPATTSISFMSIAKILSAQKPYRVPWTGLKLRILHVEVVPNQMLYALNGSIVGLCVDPSDAHANAHANAQPNAHPHPPIAGAHTALAPTAASHGPTSATALPEVTYAGLRCLKATPLVPCVGLGIVRSIDPATQTFYILTPVPLAALGSVSVLLKGGLELPSVLLFQGSPVFAEPYLLSSSLAPTAAAAGATAMQSRNNLMRRRLSGKKA